MKKLLFFKLLALMACLSSALGAAAYSFSSVYNGVTIYYNITSSTNKTVEVTYKENSNIDGIYSGHVTIPSSVTYSGTTYTVTAIGAMAFINNKNLTGVTIPNTVTSIGEDAFTYSEGGWWPNQITSITIPNSVITIGESAFSKCYSLQTVVIGDGVTTIGDYAFWDCGNITEMTVGKSVTSIGKKAFCFNGSGGWDYQEYGEDCLRPVTLHFRSIFPPTIDKNTFSDKTDPAAEDWHFNPYIRYTVYVYGPFALSQYQSATYWSNFYSVSHLVRENLYDFYTGGIYYLITNYSSNTARVCNKFGEGRTGWNGSDGDYSYKGSVTIPATAYDSYTGKTYNVTAIAKNAFDETPIMMINGSEAPSLRATGDLTSVVVGSNVTSIGENAFLNCTGLTSVTLGSSVSSIGATAFYGCTALATVTCQRSTPATIQSTTFDTNHYSTVTLKVPSVSAVNSYKAATYWKNFYLILPNGGELNYALNASGTSLSFSTTDSYPWIVKGDGTRVYAQSGNAGVASTSSSITAQVTVSKLSTVTFDFKAWGEGTSYDKCIFSIDGTAQFTYGARDNDWETYTADLPAGTHTLTWSYSKDSSVNPTGDYFAVDNVAIAVKPVTVGDVNGDNAVTISDVTALIDILLSGATAPAGADCNNDGQVTIADVTALIDYLLSGSW